MSTSRYAAAAVSIALLATACGAVGPFAARDGKKTLDALSETLAEMPIDFVQNRGQWPDRTEFFVQRGPLAAGFENDGINIYASDRSSRPLRLDFEGVSHDVVVTGEHRQGARYNFFFGNDPSRWRTDVPTYEGLVYRELYDGRAARRSRSRSHRRMSFPLWSSRANSGA